MCCEAAAAVQSRVSERRRQWRRPSMTNFRPCGWADGQTATDVPPLAEVRQPIELERRAHLFSGGTSNIQSIGRVLLYQYSSTPRRYVILDLKVECECVGGWVRALKPLGPKVITTRAFHNDGDPERTRLPLSAGPKMIDDVCPTRARSALVISCQQRKFSQKTVDVQE